MKTTLKDIVYSFIQSIDLINYLLKNHHRRVATMAWRLGLAYDLTEEQLSRLILSAALHDIGALSVEERDELIHMDIKNPHPHARLGAYMLDSFEPFQELSTIIFYHHWSFEDDENYSRTMGPVPIESYIIHLADRVDILLDSNQSPMVQRERIVEEIRQRKGSLFHPEICDEFEKLSLSSSFWMDLENKSMISLLSEVNHNSLEQEMDLELLEDFAYTVSKMIDCRSKSTVAHSFGVSEMAYKIGVCAGKDEETCRKLRVSGLLHDIGKIGVNMSLIEKNGPLTSEERKHVESHAYYTKLILGHTLGAEDIAHWAAHHHENHMGKGYPDSYEVNNITEEMDILSYADIFTALAEDRPYRKGMSREKVLKVLKEEFEVKHGSSILSVIEDNSGDLYKTCKEAIRDGHTRYAIYEMMADKYSQEVDSIKNSRH